MLDVLDVFGVRLINLTTPPPLPAEKLRLIHRARLKLTENVT